MVVQGCDMPCYNPITAWYSKHLNDNGKRGLTFTKKYAYDDRELNIPCGKCTGCRLNRSRIWAIRCVHEASLHPENCFITLTYNDENLPHDLSLNKAHHQKFMKRLRKYIGGEKRIKYFHAGEYGSKGQRPHYHTILFNYDFKDKELLSERNGNLLYTSPLLSKIWDKGFVTIGDVTFESAAYVARYCLKKINEVDPNHRDYERYIDQYSRINQETGEINFVLPEYSTQSNGIGKEWMKKYQSDLRKGFITINGVKVDIPRYYLDKLEEIDNDLYQEIKETIVNRERNTDEQTIARLRVKEKVKQAATQTLIRSLDDET